MDSSVLSAASVTYGIFAIVGLYALAFYFTRGSSGGCFAKPSTDAELSEVLLQADEAGEKKGGIAISVSEGLKKLSTPEPPPSADLPSTEAVTIDVVPSPPATPSPLRAASPPVNVAINVQATSPSSTSSDIDSPASVIADSQAPPVSEKTEVDHLGSTLLDETSNAAKAEADQALGAPLTPDFSSRGDAPTYPQKTDEIASIEKEAEALILHEGAAPRKLMQCGPALDCQPVATEAELARDRERSAVMASSKERSALSSDLAAPPSEHCEEEQTSALLSRRTEQDAEENREGVLIGAAAAGIFSPETQHETKASSDTLDHLPPHCLESNVESTSSAVGSHLEKRDIMSDQPEPSANEEASDQRETEHSASAKDVTEGVPSLERGKLNSPPPEPVKVPANQQPLLDPVNELNLVSDDSKREIGVEATQDSASREQSPKLHAAEQRSDAPDTSGQPIASATETQRDNVSERGSAETCGESLSVVSPCPEPHESELLEPATNVTEAAAQLEVDSGEKHTDHGTRAEMEGAENAQGVNIHLEDDVDSGRESSAGELEHVEAVSSSEKEGVEDSTSSAIVVPSEPLQASDSDKDIVLGSADAVNCGECHVEICGPHPDSKDHGERSRGEEIAEVDELGQKLQAAEKTGSGQDQDASVDVSERSDPPIKSRLDEVEGASERLEQQADPEQISRPLAAADDSLQDASLQFGEKTGDVSDITKDGQREEVEFAETRGYVDPTSATAERDLERLVPGEVCHGKGKNADGGNPVNPNKAELLEAASKTAAMDSSIVGQDSHQLDVTNVEASSSAPQLLTADEQLPEVNQEANLWPERQTLTVENEQNVAESSGQEVRDTLAREHVDEDLIQQILTAPPGTADAFENASDERQASVTEPTVRMREFDETDEEGAGRDTDRPSPDTLSRGRGGMDVSGLNDALERPFEDDGEMDSKRAEPSSDTRVSVTGDEAEVTAACQVPPREPQECPLEPEDCNVNLEEVKTSLSAPEAISIVAEGGKTSHERDCEVSSCNRLEGSEKKSQQCEEGHTSTLERSVSIEKVTGAESTTKELPVSRCEDDSQRQDGEAREDPEVEERCEKQSANEARSLSSRNELFIAQDDTPAESDLIGDKEDAVEAIPERPEPSTANNQEGEAGGLEPLDHAPPSTVSHTEETRASQETSKNPWEKPPQPKGAANPTCQKGDALEVKVADDGELAKDEPQINRSLEETRKVIEGSTVSGEAASESTALPTGGEVSESLGQAAAPLHSERTEAEAPRGTPPSVLVESGASPASDLEASTPTRPGGPVLETAEEGATVRDNSLSVVPHVIDCPQDGQEKNETDENFQASDRSADGEKEEAPQNVAAAVESRLASEPDISEVAVQSTESRGQEDDLMMVIVAEVTSDGDNAPTATQLMGSRAQDEVGGTCVEAAAAARQESASSQGRMTDPVDTKEAVDEQNAPADSRTGGSDVSQTIEVTQVPATVAPQPKPETLERDSSCGQPHGPEVDDKAESPEKQHPVSTDVPAAQKDATKEQRSVNRVLSDIGPSRSKAGISTWWSFRKSISHRAGAREQSELVETPGERAEPRPAQQDEAGALNTSLNLESPQDSGTELKPGECSNDAAQVNQSPIVEGAELSQPKISDDLLVEKNPCNEDNTERSEESVNEQSKATKEASPAETASLKADDNKDAAPAEGMMDDAQIDGPSSSSIGKDLGVEDVTSAEKENCAPDSAKLNEGGGATTEHEASSPLCRVETAKTADDSIAAKQSEEPSSSREVVRSSLSAPVSPSESGKKPASKAAVEKKHSGGFFSPLFDRVIVEEPTQSDNVSLSLKARSEMRNFQRRGRRADAE